VLTETGDQRDQRHRAGEQRGRQFPALAIPADLALFNVPADPLAHQHGHLAVPSGQHDTQVRAGLLAGPRDDQRAEGSLELAAGPRQLRVGVVARHAESLGEFVGVKLGDQAQLDDVPLTWIEPVDRGPDQFLQFGSFRRGLDPGGRGRQVWGLFQGGQGGPGPQPAQALVARDRVEPRTQLAEVAEAVELGRGDQECILHRVRGVSWLPEH
jgi:hypothetical protein